MFRLIAEPIATYILDYYKLGFSATNVHEYTLLKQLEELYNTGRN